MAPGKGARGGAWGSRATVALAVAAPLAVLVGERVTGRSELDGAGVIFPVLMGTLLFWGMWPVLRRMSGLGTLPFCSAMICAQTVWVVCCVLALSPTAGTAAASDLGSSAGALALLGGASLALGDCGIALTIERIGIGIGPPIIFTTNIVFGSSIDYALSAASHTACRGAFLGASLAIAVGGILLNARASTLRAAPAATDAEKAALLGAAPPDDPDRNRRRALELAACVTVGIFSGGWSPLLTAAWDVRDADDDSDGSYWGLYVIFQCGEFATMAALAAAGAAHRHLSRAPARPVPALAALAVPAATGVVIGTGFVCYFLTTSADVASSTSYAIGSCCSLVSMAYSYFVFREFDGAPRPVVRSFLAAAAAYALAIFFLALGGPVFCS